MLKKIHRELSFFELNRLYKLFQGDIMFYARLQIDLKKNGLFTGVDTIRLADSSDVRILTDLGFEPINPFPWADKDVEVLGILKRVVEEQYNNIVPLKNRLLSVCETITDDTAKFVFYLEVGG